MPKPSKDQNKKLTKIEVKKTISQEEKINLFKTLENRFKQNINRHKDINWDKVLLKLEKNDKKIFALFAMEYTGGEPDVVNFDSKTEEYIFMDCSEETPDRRSICYDREAEIEREKKGVFPAGNALDIATEIGIEILTEQEYKYLQSLGKFDLKTSSWLKTPIEIRNLGGAIFGDRRFNHVFIYHNGANSFYGVRGFRGSLRV